MSKKKQLRNKPQVHVNKNKQNNGTNVTENKTDVGKWKKGDGGVVNDNKPKEIAEPKHSDLAPLNGKQAPSSHEPPVVMQNGTAQPYIDAFDRTLTRYVEYCGPNLHVERDLMVLHQQRLWVSIKQGIVNTAMEHIDTFMEHIVAAFHTHKRGVLGEQRLFRYIINQHTGKTVIDEYAINIYGLLQVACERFDESRPSNMVDLNKAVAEAEPKVAEKIYAYFNKVGSDPMAPNPKRAERKKAEA